MSVLTLDLCVVPQAFELVEEDPAFVQSCGDLSPVRTEADGGHHLGGLDPGGDVGLGEYVPDTDLAIETAGDQEIVVNGVEVHGRHQVRVLEYLETVLSV